MPDRSTEKKTPSWSDNREGVFDGSTFSQAGVRSCHLPSRPVHSGRLELNTDGCR